MAFVSVKEAIEDIKNGKMIIMVDDEERENEGDLVFAANFSTMEKVNFAITHAKGVLCVALSEEIAKRLNLDLMVKNNTSSHETAFTVTIDAKEATTGVSAFERDITIKLIAQYDSKPQDFVRPGHIFPLIAKKGGVLVRTGHTEGSVDLCKLAGITEAAVICEIVKDDGLMARRDDIEKFCKKFGINMISVSQIVEYRLKNETLVKFSDENYGKIIGKDAKFFDVQDHEGNIHRVYIFGEIGDVCNVKFQQILTGLEFLSSDKYMDFYNYVDFLHKNGGLLVFLNKTTKHSEEFKNYGIGAQILNHLNIRKINILGSNKKNTDYVAIKGFGIDIVDNE